MNGCSVQVLAAKVCLDAVGEPDVSGLGLPICAPQVVRGVFEVVIVKEGRAELVAS